MSTKIHIEQSNALYILDEKFKEVMTVLSSKSRIAKYCCQSLRYIELMKDYITAEITGE